MLGSVIHHGQRRHHRGSGSRLGQGLTLVELMITLAVLAVLLMLAAPSVRDMILMQRLRGIHAELVTDLQYARSQAVASGREVNVRVQGPGSTGTMSCYVLFHHTGHDYGLSGASLGCDCRQPQNSRCTIAGTQEIRTVQIPTSRGVTVVPANAFLPAVAFDARTGGMVLQADETGASTGTDFRVNTRIDANRALSAIVGLSGRTRACRPATSQMPVEAC